MEEKLDGIIIVLCNKTRIVLNKDDIKYFDMSGFQMGVRYEDKKTRIYNTCDFFVLNFDSDVEVMVDGKYRLLKSLIKSSKLKYCIINTETSLITVEIPTVSCDKNLQYIKNGSDGTYVVCGNINHSYLDVGYTPIGTAEDDYADFDIEVYDESHKLKSCEVG